MKTIIAGGRDYRFTPTALDYLETMRSGISEVVSGEARGADTEGRNWAISKGIPVKRFPANWDKFGLSAGYKRNRQMAEYARGGRCILFPGGKGTAHMHDIARELGLIVVDLRTLD